MNYKDINVPEILFEGKRMTGRDINFRINIMNDHKFISDRSLCYFCKADIKKFIEKAIGDLTNKDLKLLCYDSIEEYLSEPFNKNFSEDSYKKFIRFDNIKPNKEVCNIILSKPKFNNKYQDVLLC